MNATDYSIVSEAASVRRRTVKCALALVTALALAALILGGCATKPNTVDIRDLQFDPQTLTVPTGTAVTWTVHDETAHIIQTDNYGVAGKSQADQFVSQPLSPGDSFSHTFSTPGTYTYTDPLQSYMTGTIVVQ